MTKTAQPPRSRVIEKLKLQNFKRFPTFEAAVDKDLNILVGDNEAGKSTILLALDIVLGGSRAKVDAIGLENLLNAAAVGDFLGTDKKIENLPRLFVEVYLTEQQEADLNGKNNSEGRLCDGLAFVCEPNDDLSEDIRDILQQRDPNFPFEYYEVKFFTFSGKPYAGYNRLLRHLLLDSSQINNEYATRSYIADLYASNTQGAEKNKYENEYRKRKDEFGNSVLRTLNDRLTTYSFAVKTTGKDTLESDLTITDGGIAIENKGKGQQSFIKTEFALKKSGRKVDIDILLLEEPENHLSHLNMKKLVRKIRESSGKQVFIATHSDLISSRLDLRKCILLNSNNTTPVLLESLKEETAEFFMKAPDNNVLEFILSKKAILVEGDAEYILAEAFFALETGQAMEASDVHVISVGGTSFKRYLELAVQLGIKTAVLRDNDEDYERHCVEQYSEYTRDSIKVFSDKDNNMHTFEVCLYSKNKDLCDELFGSLRRTLTVLEYMLKNKTDCALRLLQKSGPRLQPPPYFSEAIQWINK